MSGLVQGIAKFSDTGAEILLKSSLLTEASITGATNGAGDSITGTFTAQGTTANIDPVKGVGNSCSAKFIDLQGYTQLDHQGQICFEAETNYFTEYDNDASEVSGSTGLDRAATGNMFDSRDEATGNSMSWACSTSELNTVKINPTASSIAKKVTSVGKNSFTEVCIWWKGSEWGIFLDGRPFASANGVYNSDRGSALEAGQLKRLVIAASGGGTSNYFVGHIRNLVVSRTAPRFFSIPDTMSAGIFGDSFATHSDKAADAPRYDNGALWGIWKKLNNKNKRCRLVTDDYSGYSVCDRASGDELNGAPLTSAVAIDAQYVVILAGNNDVSGVASDAEITDGTTGTEKRYQEFITAFTANNNNKKVIICAVGSIRNSTTNWVAAQRSRWTLVYDIQAALPAWWDTNNPTDTGRVIFYDMWTDLGGDVEGNLNYQGALNALGNATKAAGVEDDRHPSGQGHEVMAQGLYNIIFPEFN